MDQGKGPFAALNRLYLMSPVAQLINESIPDDLMPGAEEFNSTIPKTDPTKNLTPTLLSLSKSRSSVEDSREYEKDIVYKSPIPKRFTFQTFQRLKAAAENHWNSRQETQKQSTDGASVEGSSNKENKLSVGPEHGRRFRKSDLARLGLSKLPNIMAIEPEPNVRTVSDEAGSESHGSDTEGEEEEDGGDSPRRRRQQKPHQKVAELEEAPKSRRKVLQPHQPSITSGGNRLSRQPAAERPRRRVQQRKQGAPKLGSIENPKQRNPQKNDDASSDSESEDDKESSEREQLGNRRGKQQQPAKKQGGDTVKERQQGVSGRYRSQENPQNTGDSSSDAENDNRKRSSLRERKDMKQQPPAKKQVDSAKQRRGTNVHHGRQGRQHNSEDSSSDSENENKKKSSLRQRKDIKQQPPAKKQVDSAKQRRGTNVHHGRQGRQHNSEDSCSDSENENMGALPDRKKKDIKLEPHQQPATQNGRDAVRQRRGAEVSQRGAEQNKDELGMPRIKLQQKQAEASQHAARQPQKQRTLPLRDDTCESEQSNASVVPASTADDNTQDTAVESECEEDMVVDDLAAVAQPTSTSPEADDDPTPVASRAQDDHTHQEVQADYGQKPATRSRDQPDDEVKMDEWSLRPSGKGVCLEGHRLCDPAGIYWTSSSIVARLGKTLVATGTGRRYHLVGQMSRHNSIELGIPKNVCKEFASGFPDNWKKILTRHGLTKSNPISMQTPKILHPGNPSQLRGKRGAPMKKKAKISSRKPLDKESQKLIDLSDLPRTRSGRLVKPQLAWWANQRVVVHSATDSVLIEPGTPTANLLGIQMHMFREDQLAKSLINASVERAKSLKRKYSRTNTSTASEMESATETSTMATEESTEPEDEQNNMHVKKSDHRGAVAKQYINSASVTDSDTPVAMGARSRQEKLTGRNLACTLSLMDHESTPRSSLSSGTTSSRIQDTAPPASETQASKSDFAVDDLAHDVLTVLKDHRAARLAKQPAKTACYHRPLPMKQQQAGRRQRPSEANLDILSQDEDCEMPKVKSRRPVRKSVLKRFESAEDDVLSQDMDYKAPQKSRISCLVACDSTGSSGDLPHRSHPKRRAHPKNKHMVESDDETSEAVLSRQGHSHPKRKPAVKSDTEDFEEPTKIKPRQSCSEEMEYAEIGRVTSSKLSLRNGYQTGSSMKNPRNDQKSKVGKVKEDNGNEISRRPKLQPGKSNKKYVEQDSTSSESEMSTGSIPRSDKCRAPAHAARRKTRPVSTQDTEDSQTWATDELCRFRMNDQKSKVKKDKGNKISRQTKLRPSKSSKKYVEEDSRSSESEMSTGSIPRSDKRRAPAHAARRKPPPVKKDKGNEISRRAKLQTTKSNKKYVEQDSSSSESEMSTGSIPRSDKCRAPAHAARRKPPPVSTQDTEGSQTWATDELCRFRIAFSKVDPTDFNMWNKISREVGTRSAQECKDYHFRPLNSAKVAKKAKPRVIKDKVTKPSQLTGGAGTMKRRRQLREFIDNHNQGYADDFFDSTPFKKKSLKVPDIGDSLNELFPSQPGFQTPGQATPMVRHDWMPVSEKKTPHSSVATPGLLKSVDRNAMDGYVHQLMRRRHGRRIRNDAHTNTFAEKKLPAAPKCPEVDVEAVFKTDQSTNMDHDSEEEMDYYFSEDEA